MCRCSIEQSQCADFSTVIAIAVFGGKVCTTAVSGIAHANHYFAGTTNQAAFIVKSYIKQYGSIV